MKIKNLVIALSIVGFSGVSYAATLEQNDYLKTQYDHAVNKIYSEQSAPELTVVTYNIAGGLFGHKLNINDMAEAIKTLDADLIALQEVDKNTDRNGSIDQLGELAKLTNMHGFFAKTIDVSNGEYGTAILSKYPIDKVKSYPIPSGEYEQRAVIVAKINIPKFETPVYFLNVHTDWHHDNTVRLQQAEALNAFTTDDAGVRDDFPDMLTGIMILGGDFNDVEGSAVINKLQNFWNEVRVPNVDMRTWPAANPALGLDHIFTSKGQQWKIEQFNIPNKVENWDKINWPLVSDHLPIIVKMKLIEQ